MTKVLLSDFLIEAKKLIEDPAKWTTGWFAKDIEGKHVSSVSVQAVCFCSLGAIECASGVELEDVPSNSFYEYASEALAEAMAEDVDDFNDSHTHAEVMEKWDEAIKLSIEKESK